MYYLIKDTQIKASYISLDAPVNGFKVVRIPNTVSIDEADPTPAAFDADSMVNQKYQGLLVEDPSFSFAVWDEIGFEEPDVDENPASQLPFDTGASTAFAGGDQKYWLKGSPEFASALLDFSANPLDGETVALDGKLYRFQDTLTNIDGHIQIDVDEDVTRDRFIAAVNLTGTAGTDYASATTKHPTMRADLGTGTTAPADYAVRVFARTAGTAGNAIAVEESITFAEWEGGTVAGSTSFRDLEGGTNPYGNLDTTAIDISGDGVFDRFKVYWDIFSISRTEEGNRLILDYTPELPDMVNVSISNNGGATFTPVQHLTATTLAAPGSSLMLRFENTSQTRYYIGSFAILY